MKNKKNIFNTEKVSNQKLTYLIKNFKSSLTYYYKITKMHLKKKKKKKPKNEAFAKKKKKNAF
jgi:ferritin-like protein